jgi:hypothetical protein
LYPSSKSVDGRMGKLLDRHPQPWSSETSSELHVLGLNGNPLGVNSTEVSARRARTQVSRMPKSGSAGPAGTGMGWLTSRRKDAPGRPLYTRAKRQSHVRYNCTEELNIRRRRETDQ